MPQQQLNRMKEPSDRSVRKLAKALGYTLRKSRTERITAKDHGEYMLVDTVGNYVVCGERYNASLRDVADFLIITS